MRSRYAEFDLIAVGGRITISRIRNGAATQVAQETVDYTTIPTNGLFVSRAPAPLNAVRYFAAAIFSTAFPMRLSSASMPPFQSFPGK